MDTRLLSAIIFAGVLTAIPESGQSIYLCQDPEGRQVLTDRPAQLQFCNRMDPSSSPATESRRTPPGSLPEPPRSIPPADPAGKSPANSPESGMAVPIERIGQLFLITVRLSGNTGESDARLIVDTGASHTILSHKLALQLGLLSEPQSGSVTMHTVGGTVQAPLARIKSIRIGEAEVANSFVVIHDLPDSPGLVEGLLGLDALQHFQVTLDPGKGLLVLHPALP